MSEWTCQKCGKPTRENTDLCLSCAMGESELASASGSAVGCETCEWNKLQVRHMHEALGMARAEFGRLGREFAKLKAEMMWLDQHCSFVADAEYNLGPFKVGELRLLAQAGIAADKQNTDSANRQSA